LNYLCIQNKREQVKKLTGQILGDSLARNAEIKVFINPTFVCDAESKFPERYRQICMKKSKKEVHRSVFFKFDEKDLLLDIFCL